VAGYVATDQANVAMYWKDGVATPLSDGTRDAKALSVVVSNGDVYVAGGETNDSQVDVATYWKNGVPVALTDGTRQAMAEAITLSGGDVYVAGYQTDRIRGWDVVTYWKNGEAMPLGSAPSGEARAIAVSGNDVYVAGWTLETSEVTPGNYVTAPMAKVWKNGEATWLSDGTTTTSVAEAMVVDGQDVYIAGYSAPNGVDAPYTAQYWKNGKAIPLTDGSSGAKAFSIALEKGAVYVGGFSTHKAVDTATIWKDGRPFLATNGSASLILGLAVLEQNVFAVGVDDGVVKYWHNGIATALSKKGQDAEASSIFLTTH
jgi:hypothetical protein